MVDVSFIIPSYNSFKTISCTLASITNQTAHDHVREVILVDCSDDGKTRDLFANFKDSKFKKILVNRKSPPSLLRNTGAQEAHGTILCFIDSDVYLESHWLENVLQAYKSGCPAGAGSVSAPEFQEKNNLAMAQLYLQFNESLQVGTTRPVMMVPACNMFVERRCFEIAGGFPDIRASEDVLLCFKLQKLGGVYLIPQARCFHIFRQSFGSYFNNQKLLGKYIIIYRRMIYDRWYYKGLWPVMMLPIFLGIKTVRIVLRIFSSGWTNVERFLVSLPLFVAGLFFWSVGFFNGCFSKE